MCIPCFLAVQAFIYLCPHLYTFKKVSQRQTVLQMYEVIRTWQRCLTDPCPRLLLVTANPSVCLSYPLGSTCQALSHFGTYRSCVRAVLAGHGNQVIAIYKSQHIGCEILSLGRNFKIPLTKGSNQKAAVNHQQENCTISRPDASPEKKPITSTILISLIRNRQFNEPEKCLSQLL